MKVMKVEDLSGMSNKEVARQLFLYEFEYEVLPIMRKLWRDNGRGNVKRQVKSKERN